MAKVWLRGKLPLGLPSPELDTQTIIAIAAPLVVLQFVLVVLALRDLVRPERMVKGPSKLVWGVIIVLGELLGPLVYFVFGRQEQEA